MDGEADDAEEDEPFEPPAEPQVASRPPAAAGRRQAAPSTQGAATGVPVPGPGGPHAQHQGPPTSPFPVSPFAPQPAPYMPQPFPPLTPVVPGAPQRPAQPAPARPAAASQQQPPQEPRRPTAAASPRSARIVGVARARRARLDAPGTRPRRRSAADHARLTRHEQPLVVLRAAVEDAQALVGVRGRDALEPAAAESPGSAARKPTAASSWSWWWSSPPRHAGRGRERPGMPRHERVARPQEAPLAVLRHRVLVGAGAGTCRFTSTSSEAGSALPFLRW